MSDGAEASGAGQAAESTGPSLNSVTAAADAATKAFIARGSAPAAEASDAADEIDVTIEDGDPEPEPEKKQDEKQERKRLQRQAPNPTNAEEAFRSRVKARADAARGGQQPVDTNAAMKAEVERLKSEGLTSSKRLAEFEAAAKARDPEAFARLGGWDSVEQFTREFLKGQSEKPPEPTAREKELLARLEKLEGERDSDRKTREEQSAKAESERDYQEQLSWLRDVAEKHEVDEVRAAVSNDHPIVKENFLAQVHELLMTNPNLPMDEAYGVVLDGYKPIMRGLLAVFPDLVQEYLDSQKDSASAGRQQGRNPDAARGSKPGRDRTRQSEASRRGSTVEGSKKPLDSDNTADKAERLTAENAHTWGDDHQRKFIARVRTA